MSVSEHKNIAFVTLKIIDKITKFSVDSWKEKETKYGIHKYLIGQFVEQKGVMTPKGKHMLKMTATNWDCLEVLGVKHLDELRDQIITIEKKPAPSNGAITATIIKVVGFGE